MTKKPTNKSTKPTRRSRTDDEVDLDEKWGTEAARIIRATLKRRGLSLTQLAEMPTEHGRPTELQMLKNTLTRGQFKAAWFLDVLNMLGESDVRF